MKRVKLLIVAVVLGITAHAELLVTEDFNYESGAGMPVGSWFFQWPNTYSGMAVVTPGLSFPGYPGSEIGNALLMEGDYSNDQPHLAFKEVTSGDVFVAFMIEPTLVTKSGWFLTLRDNKVDNSTFNYCARVYVTEDDTLGLRFFKKAEAVFKKWELKSDKTYLLLLKYHIVAGNHNDEVSLYAFEKMPTTLPAEPLIGPLTDPEAPDINPAHVVLHGFDDDGWLTVDGIRVATTWEEALGITSEEPDEPDRPENPDEGVDAIHSGKSSAIKVYRNGQIVILRNGKAMNILGQTL